MNKVPTEICAILGAINPQSAGAGSYSTGWIPMKNFRRFLAIIMVGAMTSTGTMTAKLTAATSAAGAGATDVPGSTITTLTQAGADDNKQVEINFDGASLAGTPKFTHFRLTVTTATAASLAAALVLGFDPLYAPASDNDATTVDEIVTVQ